jgi:hypothetical protein
MQQSADGSFDWPVVGRDLHRFVVEGAGRMGAAAPASAGVVLHHYERG